MNMPIEDEATGAEEIVVKDSRPERIFLSAVLNPNGALFWYDRRYYRSDTEYICLDVAETHHAAELQERGELQEKVRMLGDLCGRLQAVVDAVLDGHTIRGTILDLRMQSQLEFDETDFGERWRWKAGMADALEALAR